MKREDEKKKVGAGDGEGAPGYRLHLESRSKPFSFLKIAQPFPQQGWQQGLREARLPFYGKKIPDPQEGAGLELVVLDEAQPWGLGWDLLGGGCDLVGFPGLGGLTSCEERAEVGWQHWSPSIGMEGLLRDIRSAPFPCFIGEETESQRVEEIMGSPGAG